MCVCCLSTLTSSGCRKKSERAEAPAAHLLAQPIKQCVTVHQASSITRSAWSIGEKPNATKDWMRHTNCCCCATNPWTSYTSSFIRHRCFSHDTGTAAATAARARRRGSCWHGGQEEWRGRGCRSGPGGRAGAAAAAAIDPSSPQTTRAQAAGLVEWPVVIATASR